MNTMETKKKETTKTESVKKEQVNMLVLVRIAGQIGNKKILEDTLRMLNLSRKHMCTIIPATPTYLGMVRKVKDLITWGETDAETIKLLKEKRGQKNQEGNLKPFFRLQPPRGGYERKGTKVGYQAGGALGYRGIKINDLIKRMI